MNNINIAYAETTAEKTVNAAAPCGDLRGTGDSVYFDAPNGLAVRVSDHARTKRQAAYYNSAPTPDIHLLILSPEAATEYAANAVRDRGITRAWIVIRKTGERYTTTAKKLRAKLAQAYAGVAEEMILAARAEAVAQSDERDAKNNIDETGITQKVTAENRAKIENLAREIGKKSAAARDRKVKNLEQLAAVLGCEVDEKAAHELKVFCRENQGDDDGAI